jgi:hypothetical protein
VVGILNLEYPSVYSIELFGCEFHYPGSMFQKLPPGILSRLYDS